MSRKLVGSSRPHEAVREIIAHPLTDRKESAMYKIHLFVDAPEVCLTIREVRVIHFVVLKNDTADNFEIAFAYLHTKDSIRHFGLFISSEIPEKEREKYIKLITDYAKSNYIDGKRQESRAKQIEERFGDAGLLAILNYNSVVHGRTYIDQWKNYYRA